MLSPCNVTDLDPPPVEKRKRPQSLSFFPNFAKYEGRTPASAHRPLLAGNLREFFVSNSRTLRTIT